MTTHALLVSGSSALARRCLALRRAAPATMGAIAAGEEVLVVGRGPVMLLAAKLAAIKGFKTSVLLGNELSTAISLVDDDSLPITMLPVAGEDADAEKIEAAVTGAKGLIIAFDGEEVVPQGALDVFMPASGLQKLSHVSVLSRNLNGNGMGFFASAAKTAANAEIWAGGKSVEAYKDMEARVKARAGEVGASWTVIRSGTLKGGGCGDPTGGSGDPNLLSTTFYTMGQQDIVNWKMLFDCDTLGVKLSKGDVLPGPGFTAAFGATSAEVCDGDSGRGGVAAALVEALRLEAATGSDFGVGTQQSRTSPTDEEWKELFAKA